MRTAALFAGIGGLELGLARAGHRTELFSEIWAPAAAVLENRFPGVDLRGDVAEVEALPRGVELLTAGFPCQDLSQAGRTAGISGPRSGLVGHVFRLLDDRPIDWVVLENVSFMLHLDGGRAMETLVRAFEERGYRWAYRVVNTLAFLPQRRERVFFVASRVGAPEDVLLTDDVPHPERETTLDTHAHGFYWTEGVRGLGWAPDAVPTIKNGSSVGIPAPPAILFPDGMVAKPAIEDAERLQGFPAGWTEPAVASGRRSNWRWSLVGNAVSVPVAEWVGSRLARPGSYDAGRDRPLTGPRWPRSARFDGRRRHAVAIGDAPVWRERPSLVAFLSVPADPLSVRATAGFLDRTGKSRLRFVPGFRERVAAHLDRMRGHDRAFGIAAE